MEEKMLHRLNPEITRDLGNWNTLLFRRTNNNILSDICRSFDNSGKPPIFAVVLVLRGRGELLNRDLIATTELIHYLTN